MVLYYIASLDVLAVWAAEERPFVVRGYIYLVDNGSLGGRSKTLSMKLTHVQETLGKDAIVIERNKCENSIKCMHTVLTALHLFHAADTI